MTLELAFPLEEESSVFSDIHSLASTDAILYSLHDDDTSNPQTIAGAKQSKYWIYWLSTIHEELKSLKTKGIYDKVSSIPWDCKVVQCKWVLHIKHDKDRTISCFKARLVTKGFTDISPQIYASQLTLNAKKPLPFHFELLLANACTWLHVHDPTNLMLFESSHGSYPTTAANTLKLQNTSCSIYKVHAHEALSTVIFRTPLHLSIASLTLIGPCLRVANWSLGMSLCAVADPLLGPQKNRWLSHYLFVKQSTSCVLIAHNRSFVCVLFLKNSVSLNPIPPFFVATIRELLSAHMTLILTQRWNI